MIGVVLWSDLDDQKAVFWCEDHGDLAYFDAAVDSKGDYALFTAGDMVQFDITLHKNMRLARNAEIVQQKVCRGLQDHLRSTAQDHDAGHSTAPANADVLPFQRRDASKQSERRTVTA